MQTITTKYLGPTNTLGARLKATHTSGYASVTLGYDHALNSTENHRVAAQALAEKLGWQGDYVGGHTKDGMVFVNAAPAYTFTTARNKEAA